MSRNSAEPDAPAKSLASEVWNVPNLITMARIALSLIVFGLLPLELYRASLILFLIAATTDKLDGWYARRFNLVTQLGRILDPIADKLIICGTFIYLVAIPELTSVAWGLRAWMVVVIVLREMLVTGLRSLVEGRGGDFSAQWSGKIKMVFQCAAAAFCLLSLSIDSGSAFEPSVRWAMIGSLWIAIVSTVHSGLVYVVAAARIIPRLEADA